MADTASPGSSPETHLVHGLRLLETGRITEAETAFQEVLRLAPEQAEAIHGLGLAAKRSGRRDRALQRFRQAAALAPGNPLFLVSIALHHLEQGEEDPALESLLRAEALAPSLPEVFFFLGMILHARGDLDGAVVRFERAIALHPDFPEAYNNLGAALRERGESARAAAAFQKAVALRPAFAEALTNLGSVHHERGMLVEAVAAFEAAMAANPGYPMAALFLGRLHHGQGERELAARAFSQAIAAAPDLTEAHFELAVIRQEEGRLDEARDGYVRALAFQPDYAAALVNLGHLFQLEGRREEALSCLRRAVDLDPNNPSAHSNLAVLLVESGDEVGARAALGRALILDPLHVEACNNLGNLALSQGDLAEAVLLFKKAVDLDPGHAEALNNLGAALQRQRQTARARACYEKALALKPDFPEAHGNLGAVLEEMEEYSLAIDHLQRALARQPEKIAHLFMVHRSLCDWEGDGQRAEGVRQVVRDGVEIHPFALLGLDDDPALQLQASRQWAASHLRAIRPLEPPPSPPAGSRIRIGYLSSDFREHATSYLLADFLEAHDRTQVEVFAFSFGQAEESPMRRRIMAACDRFTNLGNHSHGDMARAIRQADIEILVDLKGYTRDARPQVLALRPAPVQVGWLGYPGSVGASFLDYIIADPFLIPPGSESHYSEQVIRLPHCYQPNDRKRVAGARLPRRVLGLPEEAVVLCAFNNTWKIHPELFACWCRILQRVPDAVLWLYDPHGQAAPPLRREAAAAGIDPGRLVFAPFRPHSQHLVRLQQADLFLDTFPCNGHTTVSDALWAGVPVVTRVGGSFASRVAGSLLTAVALPEGITSGWREYEDKAVAWARDRALLASLRDRLTAARETAPLFDTPLLVRHLEEACRRILARWRQGLPPQGLDLPVS